ncbi:PIG-L family deacetylase [Marixanthomonas spongiae]|uniref:LmbE family protein n=1 Tax=Marixanthomonas spongiae TaxID=2174845 RepID=A0A2U0HYE2_9FLAO|nr:PIG-L family deacetylase [Marixanthomonas spongiae]PVW13892.1 LmbE family protein [Marixanthomonas spongiae]
MRNFFTALLLYSISITSLFAQQPEKPTASEIYHDLQQLNFLGSAMYIAAHPDDENTRLISYLVNDVHARTAYLSLTRGDGGQNLLGPEIRELLGVIRTQELLAARRIDGGEQFFTRANDFGYSKNPTETLDIWNKNEVLSDVVRAIRKFKPDVIINRFDHRSSGSTHGHHTASAMLSVEAFDLATNPNSYPETANTFGTWQPKRLFFNTSWWFYGSQEKFEQADKSNLVEVQTGNYYPSLGLSNGEIASLSRSMHKSQGFGSTGTRGNQSEWLEFLKGDFSEGSTNLFEGIDTSWSRIEGGETIGGILYPLEDNFDFKNPSRMLRPLLQAYELVKNIEDDHWRTVKMKQLEQLILDCGGIFVEAVAHSNSIMPREKYQAAFETINRSDFPMTLESITYPSGKIIVRENETLAPNENHRIDATLYSESTTTSGPYWLQEKGTLGMYKAPEHLIGKPETPAPEQVVFNLVLGGTKLAVKRNIVYKYNDPVKGEVYQPFEVMPEATSRIAEKVIIFSSKESKTIPVTIRAGRDHANGTVQLNHPKGWQVSPAQPSFNIAKKGDEQTILFTVTPPKGQSEGYLSPLISMGDQFFDKELITIDYEHIPYQRVLLPSEAKVVRIDIEKEGESIGYIEGAGDAIPESLRQIGYRVTTIPPSKVTYENLKEFDAVVVGIRAYNTVPELAFKQPAFNEYVQEGGTLLLQYNTSRGLVTENLAPYSLSLSRDRVTDEHSDVTFLAPDHPVLNEPNKITQADFEGWVQERGLYFPNQWAPKFVPILGMHDKGEPQTKGALLVAEYGKGRYIYTGLSFFRELPAGVAGAYRLFANLLSLGN